MLGRQYEQATLSRLIADNGKSSREEGLDAVDVAPNASVLDGSSSLK